jgi:hypothetical protein
MELGCTSVRNPAADEPYMKKLTQRLNRSLNRNRNGANTTRRNMKTAAKPANKELKFKTIIGDLLKMPTGDGNYIVQQCCCTCTKPAGLAAIIAKKWPALNPYAGRKAVGRTQTATLETRDKFGSAKLIRDEANDVNLICLFAQYGPGKAGTYEDDFVEPVDDGTTNRLKKFKVALTKIASIAPAGSTLYFPHGIGSGLGGGKWENYLAAIHDFSKKNEMGYKVIIVHKE